nr:serine/threonine-protein kinase MARK2-like [Dasypus novemcinctus]
MLRPLPALRAKEETHLKNYQFLRLLGKGGFSMTFLARHVLTRHEVVVKIIHKKDSPSSLRMRSREVSIMKSLHHPNIVQLFEVIDSPEKLYLVMEYAHGGDLLHYLMAHGPLSEEEARAKFRQVLSAVQYCHQKCISHRDLKADNLLLDAAGNVKVTDFGLSNTFDISQQLETLCGTPCYTAPEIFKGHTYLGPAVDVWSLGVILYNMVSGKFPFFAQNSKLLQERVLSGEFRIPYYLSVDCRNLLQKCLTVDPCRRSSLPDIMTDPWVNTGYEHAQLRPYVEPLPARQDPHRIAAMVAMGYKEEEIQASLQDDRHDEVMAIYLLLGHSRWEQGTSTSAPQTQPPTRPGVGEAHLCALPAQPAPCPGPPCSSPPLQRTILSQAVMDKGRESQRMPEPGASKTSASPAGPLALPQVHQQPRMAWVRPTQAARPCPKERRQEGPLLGPAVTASSHVRSSREGGSEGSTHLSAVGTGEAIPRGTPQVRGEQKNLPCSGRPASPPANRQGQPSMWRRFWTFLCLGCACKELHQGRDNQVGPQGALPRSRDPKWRMKVMSSLEPHEIMGEICRVLDALGCEWDLKGPHGLLCMCGTPGQEDFLQWRVEVCRLPRRGLHGVQVKRVSGSSRAFRDIEARLTKLLQV